MPHIDEQGNVRAGEHPDVELANAQMRLAQAFRFPGDVFKAYDEAFKAGNVRKQPPVPWDEIELVK